MNTKYLVAIADTHGNNEVLGKVSGQIRALLERYHKPLDDCALLYLGDALPSEKVEEKEVPGHYEKLTQALANAGLPVIGTGGSYDIEDAIRTAFEKKGWHFLHGETAEWNGLKFGGYGGSHLKPEAAEEELGLSQEKFVQFSEEDLAKKLGEAEIDIFLHHTMPYGFADNIGYRTVMTSEGPALAPVNIGAEAIHSILKKANPILSICGHLHERTASTTVDRTVLIKCHGFERGERYSFPVYYVEIGYDHDGKPFVKSNVDINFIVDEGFAQLAPKPIVSCREEYEPNAEEMVHHYRIQKGEVDGLPVIIKAIKTSEGKFKSISQAPALAGSDDISWAFAGDEKDEGVSEGGIILM